MRLDRVDRRICLRAARPLCGGQIVLPKQIELPPLFRDDAVIFGDDGRLVGLDERGNPPISRGERFVGEAETSGRAENEREPAQRDPESFAVDHAANSIRPATLRESLDRQPIAERRFVRVIEC